MASQTETVPNDIPEGSSERDPLLEAQTRSEAVLVESQQGQIDPSMAKVDKKQKGWELAWKTVIWVLSIIFVFLVVKGFIEGGDTSFDWKKTFKDALGGGLSGAAGGSR